MTSLTCRDPLQNSELLEYWLNELEPSQQQHIEEHCFCCDTCAKRLEQLVSLSQAVQELVRTGALFATVTARFIARLEASGLKVRKYHVPLNHSVNCTIAPDDDLVVGYLEAPLKGVKRLDIVTDMFGDPDKLEDVPFDERADEVVFVPAARWLRTLDTDVATLRLVAVDDHGERELGQYTFKHSRFK